VRAGYRYDPAPFNLTYIPFDSEDVIDIGRDPAEIDIAIDRERQFLSFGAGYLFDRVLAVDVAYQMGRLERVSEDPSRAPYREERSSDEVILSVGYRF